MKLTMSAEPNNDAQLVESSLRGDRDAFARIVERYRSLVCSITYNVTGSLSASEDIAQETFFAAWKQLPQLREPSLLRSWLCGIARFLVGKELQRRSHEPSHAAEPLDAVHDAPSPAQSPSAEAVSREEEAILWRALERIPEIYREPLILFYREQQSVERVAAELDLSEDAVKQRLSRGRKLLHAEVMDFVEGTLRRTAPGEAFSEAVLAGIPVAPAGSAGAGLAAKSGFLGGLLLPVIGVASGILANCLLVLAAPTGRERRVKKLAFIGLWVFGLGCCVAQFAVRVLGQRWHWSDAKLYGVMAGFWWSAAILMATWIIVMFRRLVAIRGQGGEGRTRMTVGVRVSVAAGLCLGSFSWLIALAWRAHDGTSVGIIVGTMVVLTAWHFSQFRGRAGTGALWAGIGRLGVNFAVILAILNLRWDSWMAAIRGTDLAEVHGLLPAWVIPVATVSLIIWIAVVFAMTKPARPSGKGLLLLMFALIWAPTGKSQQPPPPFRALYQELDETLHQATQSYPLGKAGANPLFAPSLFLAGSGYGDAAVDSTRWNGLLATLDAFQAMRMNAVSVMIAAPDLTLAAPGPLVGFYQRLAGEIHSRHMKLYVEHFVNPPLSPHGFKDLTDNPQGRRGFLKLMENEVTVIYSQIKPDYLSLLTEPETTMIRWSHLTFTADEMADWVARVAMHLKSSGASPQTLLGTGAGTWESEDFVLKFAQQKDLDYLDLHLYALRLNGSDQVAKFAALIRKVRESRPDMRVTIGETWLYKHGGEEPNGMWNKDAYFRDNFSFWSPLDEQFLRLLLGIARKENISVIAPYFSQYFFSYYTFGDVESSKLPQWPGSVPASWDKALESIRDHRLSSTGKAMSGLLDNNGR